MGETPLSEDAVPASVAEPASDGGADVAAAAASAAGVSGKPGVENRPLEREILRSRCRLF